MSTRKYRFLLVLSVCGLILTTVAVIWLLSPAPLPDHQHLGLAALLR